MIFTLVLLGVLGTLNLGLAYLTFTNQGRLWQSHALAYGQLIDAVNAQRQAHNATVEVFNHNWDVMQGNFDILIREDAAREDFEFLEPGSNALPS